MRSVPVGAVEGRVGLTAVTACTGAASVAVGVPAGFAHGKRYAIQIQAQVSTEVADGYLKMADTGAPPTATTSDYPLVEGGIFIWAPLSGWDACAFIRRTAVDLNIHVTEIAPDPV